MRRTYQAFLLSIDPQKRANCEKKGLITECVENTQKSSFIFKTDFSLREIKLKLGIVSDSDIVEINIDFANSPDFKTEFKKIE